MCFYAYQFLHSLSKGEKNPKCLGLLKIIIPNNLLSWLSSVSLIVNAELESVLELLKKLGRKEKTVVWIKTILLDRNG